MKHIKLLFSISLLLVFGSKIHSQVIKENVKFLIYSGRNNYGGNNIYSHLSSEQIYKDVYENSFYGGANYRGFIFRKDKKVYYTDENDTMLYFDYSLEVGDTFYFNGLSIYPNTKPIIIDSVKNIMLDDGKYYKHWYLYINRIVIWVEGLGEKESAWGHYDVDLLVDTYHIVRSVCADDTLIYWNPKFKSFNSHPISPTCNYDSLFILNSVYKVSNLGLIIYPNPAKDFIEISSTQNIQNADLKIYDVLGKEIWKTDKQNFPLVIDTKDFISGIYFIKIKTHNQHQYETHKIIIQH